jgi:hypothetical protein
MFSRAVNDILEPGSAVSMTSWRLVPQCQRLREAFLCCVNKSLELVIAEVSNIVELDTVE